MSSKSSSTQSLNSIPVSSDGEAADPLGLKEVDDKTKPKPPRPPPPRSNTITSDDVPRRPPPPRSMTLGGARYQEDDPEDADGDKEKKKKKKKHKEHKEKKDKKEKKEKKDKKEKREKRDKSETGEGSSEGKRQSVTSATSNKSESKLTSEETREEGEEQPSTGWKKLVNSSFGIWQATTSTVSTAKNATVNAAVYAKDSTVNAAVKTKDATVNAAVYAKDSTVHAAVKTKDATVNAAVYAKDTTVTAATTAKDATYNASSAAATGVTSSFANVVVLARKAAKDTRYRMGPAADAITIIHYNDVYNVEARDQEPVGGAARFCTAVKKFEEKAPLVLFSGDIFAPSIMSTMTKGEQMIPVMEKIGTQCACFGNHDFDFGIDTLTEHMEKTSFPWLISNVVDNETGRPLADGLVTHVMDWCGRKIGLMGLVENEWLDTLATINPEEVTFTDYVEAGKMLSAELREKGCEYIIALTHMRTPNDVRLAEEVDEIDLILGGHDHVYEKKMINGKYILKSGTDFRQFSVLTIDFTGEKPEVEIEAVEVTADYEPDEELVNVLEKYQEKMEAEMCKELGEFQCDLDGRFSSIRTQETNLGNFICDIMVASTNADFALLNSGTLRSDQVHAAGPFFLKDLLTILPMIDQLVLVEVTGEQVLQCLENGVSQYPKLEGRFPQVSGISFAFDPKKPKGSRVDAQYVKIGDEYLKNDGKYHMATKDYLAMGKDGYDCLADCKLIIDDENGPTLTVAVQNHFKALAMREGRTRRSSVHHQSLITLSRRTSIVRQLTDDGAHHIPARLPERFHSMDLSTLRPKLKKQATISDLECIDLNPRNISKLKRLKDRHLKGEIIMEEDEDQIYERSMVPATDEDIC
eukprot:maker-scaffold791_size96783-snap-gene-0.28 protein:Tk03160 transcript:maker-scaffold791_size96783-snap-gene-0.28-mRNA-1 annotation:"5 -nucleotidase"